MPKSTTDPKAASHKSTHKPFKKVKSGKHVLERLTDLQVRRQTRPGVFADGGGLYLHISPTGAKSWLFRYKRKLGSSESRARAMGLGPIHTVSLVEARQKALAQRKLLLEGMDPLEHRKATRTVSAPVDGQGATSSRSSSVTLADAIDAFLTAKAGELSGKHGAQWESTLATYITPLIGERLVCELEPADIADTLKSADFWSEKTETAVRTRQRVEAVLDWATVQKYRQGPNPARWGGCLEHLLPSPAKIQTKRKHPALAYLEMPEFALALRKQAGQGARALELTILTGCRSQEVRFARWREIDLENRLWTIPAEHMKAKVEHRVPLSTQAVALLMQICPSEVDPDALLFPGKEGQPLSDMTISKAIKTLNAGPQPRWVDRKQGNAPVVPHGFRATFRTWAMEVSSHDRVVCELALAHAVGDDVEAAYARGELMEKRARLMQEWADFWWSV
jgi:integrase